MQEETNRFHTNHKLIFYSILLMNDIVACKKFGIREFMFVRYFSD